MKDVFTNIIKNRYWRDVPCGSGSTLEFTAPLRENLKSFLESNNIKSMLDAPCGDYSWMSITSLPENFKYIGGDIVEFMIHENQEKFPGVEFTCVDITTDALPDVDLMFCRDCLIHLSHHDIRRFFENFVKSKIEYLMVTNAYPDNPQANQEIVTGDYRPTDFTVAPYNFSDPVDWIDDSGSHEQKVLALWHRGAIEDFLNRDN